MPGSTLLSIESGGNANDVEGLPYQSVLGMIKQGGRPLTLSFRLPPGVSPGAALVVPPADPALSPVQPLQPEQAEQAQL